MEKWKEAGKVRGGERRVEGEKGGEGGGGRKGNKGEEKGGRK